MVSLYSTCGQMSRGRFHSSDVWQLLLTLDRWGKEKSPSRSGVFLLMLLGHASIPTTPTSFATHHRRPRSYIAAYSFGTLPSRTKKKKKIFFSFNLLSFFFAGRKSKRNIVSKEQFLIGLKWWKKKNGDIASGSGRKNGNKGKKRRGIRGRKQFAPAVPHRGAAPGNRNSFGFSRFPSFLFWSFSLSIFGLGRLSKPSDELGAKTSLFISPQRFFPSPVARPV